ncbi:MAG: hypothetical protein U0234_14760 [Sandaracinus sp.]
MKDELMRRISSALDTEAGVAGDPSLQEALRADPEAAKYAKDAARVGKWLAVWPLPEPDDAAFEALAARIEQRLDEELPKIADPTEAPSFDDDDALRDATAGLLESGEFRVSEPGPIAAPAAPAPRASDPDIPMLSDPGLVLESDPGTTAAPSDAAAPAAIARVSLSKKRAPVVVEESSGSGEPLSSAELELRLAGKAGGAPPKKKKKKKAAGATTTSSDRISIPTPKPALASPPLAPVKELPRTEDRKGPSPFWWFAAAAAVGIGVFGAASLFETAAEPAARGSTLVTTGAIAPPAPPSPPPYVAPVAPAAEAALAAVPPATVVTAAPVDAPFEAEALVPQDAVAHAGGAEGDGMLGGEPPVVSRARARPSVGALRSSRAGGGLADDEAALAGRLDRAAEPSAGPAAHRSLVAGSGSGASATPTTTSSAPSPRPTTTTTPSVPPPATVATEERAPLPTTPDRSTIQTILEGRADAVRACAAGAHGLADVDVVIAGSGRITTATVNGTFAGTPVGSCIARAVRGATFPPFSQARFEVTYPYHL